MNISIDRTPLLQIEAQEPFAIDHAVVDRDVLQTRLREVTGVDGELVLLPVGAQITLYTGLSVIFMGRVEEDQSVVDLLSAEPEEQGAWLDL
jgi:hypothetical protein